jgi:DNA invertase Pin-like site-specific DNA recombinase
MQNVGMIYGYARVSTGTQDLSGQLAQLKAAGCEKAFRDKLTGATADRPQLRRLVSALAAGDVVIIPTVDRLSRDTTDLLVIAREMQQAGAALATLYKSSYATLRAVCSSRRTISVCTPEQYKTR